MKKEKSIQADIDVLKGMLDADDSPCNYDHHGYCQTHNTGEEGQCNHRRAILSAISALEEQALMRDASDALPDKKSEKEAFEDYTSSCKC